MVNTPRFHSAWQSVTSATPQRTIPPGVYASQWPLFPLASGLAMWFVFINSTTIKVHKERFDEHSSMRFCTFGILLLGTQPPSIRKSRLSRWRDRSHEEALADGLFCGERGHVEEHQNTPSQALMRMQLNTKWSRTVQST